MGPVGEGIVGVRVDLHDQPVGARGNRGQGERRDQRPAAGALRRVDDHGQVGELPNQRHRVDVEREAGRRLEGADPALAEHHVAVSLAQQVLRGQQPLLDGRGHPPLQHHGVAGAPGLLEEGVVLHVAGADLEDVRVARHQLHVARRHDLGDDLEAGLLPRAGQHLQPLLAEALEGVGRGARLEGAAPEDLRPLGRHVAGGLHQHLDALDGAGAGHHHDLVAADGDVSDPNRGVARLPLAAGQLVGLGDLDDLLDARQVGESLAVGVGVAADDADHGAVLAVRDLRCQPELADLLDDGVDLGGRRLVGHDDDQGS